MKKLIIRIIGSVCILAALAVTFFSAWVQIDGIKSKYMRSARELLIEDLERVETELLNAYEINGQIKEELKDNDLPGTKSSIKKQFNATEEWIEELIDKEISLGKAMRVSAVLPEYIENTDNLLNTSLCADLVFSNARFVNRGSLQGLVDAGEDSQEMFSTVIAVGVAAIVLGLISAVTHSLNRFRFLKFIFILLMVTIVVCACVGIPSLSEMIIEEVRLPKEAADIEIHLTVMPFVALFLSLVPLGLDLLFERKENGIVPAHNAVAAGAETEQQPPVESAEETNI